jgi:hypothetical protein
MCVGVSSSPSPPPPPPPPPIPAAVSAPGQDTIVSGSQARRRALAGAAGRRGNILTGSIGGLENPNLGTRALLGG